MKKIELRTPFGVWEITEVSEYELKFTNLKTNNSFILESNPNFPPCSASALMAFANVHNHKFPSTEQFEVLGYLHFNGMHKWMINEKVRFNFPLTIYITDEVLKTTLYNPYGDDFVFKKFVCYNAYDNKIKVIDGEQKVSYILLK